MGKEIGQEVAVFEVVRNASVVRLIISKLMRNNGQMSVCRRSVS
jgi:hypothetical protein